MAVEGLLAQGVAFITGGGSGIGRACAEAFAAEGAKVAVADRDLAGAEETCRTVMAAGGQALALKMDVTSAADVRQALAEVVEKWGRLDYAVNCAGIILPMTKIGDLSDDDWDRCLAVNLTGVFVCLREQIRHMLPQARGSIINISSGAGLKGSAGHAAYVAAKHGVVGLTKGAMLDYCRSGIRVNTICPGGIDTPMAAEIARNASEAGIANDLSDFTFTGRLGRPEEVANAAVWLASEKASYVYGASISVDGGYTAA